MGDIERWYMIVGPDGRGLHGQTYENEKIARQVAAAGINEGVVEVVPAAALRGAVGALENARRALAGAPAFTGRLQALRRIERELARLATEEAVDVHHR